MLKQQPKSTPNAAPESPNGIHLVQSAKDRAGKPLLNPSQRMSIADQCLVHLVSPWNVARQFGVKVSEVNDICYLAMWERGFKAGVNAERFSAPMDSPRTPQPIRRRAA